MASMETKVVTSMAQDVKVFQDAPPVLRTVQYGLTIFAAAAKWYTLKVNDPQMMTSSKFIKCNYFFFNQE
jgi:hypothetical protein